MVQNNSNPWRTTAIIFIVLFVSLTTLNLWAIWYVAADEENQNNCNYNVCVDSDVGLYDLGICSCYDLDEYGDYVVTKEEYIG